MEVEDSTGVYLVKLARHAAEMWVKGEKTPHPIEPIPEQATFKTGAFVTVKTVEGKERHLRGCIGYILGLDSLYQEVIDLAKASTLNDPRFPPVTRDELPHIVFEVTVMTPPQEIEYDSPQNLLDQIEVPGDGLIVKLGRFQGLLLPQVPIEQGWNSEEFLSYTCRKAFLPMDAWKKEEITVEKFQGIIFSETEPYGEIVRKELDSSC
jgi:uncharacterized protein (TIGR00296 family)